MKEKNAAIVEHSALKLVIKSADTTQFGFAADVFHRRSTTTTTTTSLLCMFITGAVAGDCCIVVLWRS